MTPNDDLRSTHIDHRISPFLRFAHAALLDVANLKAGSRTLVLECRDGWAAEEAWRRVGVGRGYVMGVDVSEDMIALAGRYREVPERLEFTSWDQRTLPFDARSFDTVISTFSLHRYTAPDRVLAETHRVLQSEGKVLVLEPLKYSFGGAYLLVDWYNRIRDPGHVRYYSRKQLRQMLVRAGFKRVTHLEHIEQLRMGGKLLANALLIEAHKGEETLPLET